MDTLSEFEDMIEGLPRRLKCLEECPPMKRDNLRNIPESVIYAFYGNG
jgi:hypothetical protein